MSVVAAVLALVAGHEAVRASPGSCRSDDKLLDGPRLGTAVAAVWNHQVTLVYGEETLERGEVTGRVTHVSVFPPGGTQPLTEAVVPSPPAEFFGPIASGPPGHLILDGRGSVDLFRHGAAAPPTHLEIGPVEPRAAVAWIGRRWLVYWSDEVIFSYIVIDADLGASSAVQTFPVRGAPFVAPIDGVTWVLWNDEGVLGRRLPTA